MYGYGFFPPTTSGTSVTSLATAQAYQKELAKRKAKKKEGK